MSFETISIVKVGPGTVVDTSNFFFDEQLSFTVGQSVSLTNFTNYTNGTTSIVGVGIGFFTLSQTFSVDETIGFATFLTFETDILDPDREEPLTDENSLTPYGEDYLFKLKASIDEIRTFLEENFPATASGGGGGFSGTVSPENAIVRAADGTGTVLTGSGIVMSDGNVLQDSLISGLTSQEVGVDTPFYMGMTTTATAPETEIETNAGLFVSSTSESYVCEVGFQGKYNPTNNFVRFTEYILEGAGVATTFEAKTNRIYLNGPFTALMSDSITISGNSLHAKDLPTEEPASISETLSPYIKKYGRRNKKTGERKLIKSRRTGMWHKLWVDENGFVKAKLQKIKEPNEKKYDT